MTALDKNKRRAFNFQSDFIQIISNEHSIR